MMQAMGMAWHHHFKEGFWCEYVWPFLKFSSYLLLGCYLCLFVCLFELVGLFVCLVVCLFVCLIVWLFVWFIIFFFFLGGFLDPGLSSVCDLFKLDGSPFFLFFILFFKCK